MIINTSALFERMKVFSTHKINLLKLEYRPILGKLWEYMFYADFEADILSDGLSPMMAELTQVRQNKLQTPVVRMSTFIYGHYSFYIV